MHAILKLLAIFSLGRGFEHLKDLFKCYALRIYVDVIDVVRNIQIILVVAIGCLILLISGFIMLNIALFLSLPWSIDNKIILLASLGAFYILAPVLAIFALHSKEKWLKTTGLKKILDDISAKE